MDTSFSKPSHTNGPVIKIFDLGTSTSTGSQPGPYAEAVVPLGWDPVGLSFVKLKVDSNGQLFIANPGSGGSGGGGGVQYQELSSVGTAGTGNLILGHDTSGTARVPTVGSFANSTAMAVQIVDAAGSQITSFGTSTTTVVQGTASNLNANISGTATIAGTATIVGTDTSALQVWGSGTAGTWTNVGFGTTGGTANLSVPVQVQAGTVAVTQVTSPWVVGGTTTTVPSGTQTVAFVSTSTVQPLRNLDFTGNGTISSTANLVSFSFQACSVGLISINGTFTGTIDIQGFFNSAGGAAMSVYLYPALTPVVNPVVNSGALNVSYLINPAGCNIVNFNPIGWTSGTATIAFEASESMYLLPVVPVGTATVAGTVTTTPTGTQTVTPIGTQTVVVTTQAASGCNVYSNQNLSVTGTSIKGSAGVLYGYDIYVVPGSLSSFVKFYNKATAPTGTDTPVMVLGFGETAAIGTQVNPGDRALFLNPPIFFSTGIGIRAEATTTNSGSATGGVTVANIFWA